MRTQGNISKAQWRKDAGSLCIAFCAIAFVPLSAFVLRPRPLAADSPNELIAVAREQTAEEAATLLAQHANSWTLQSPESRWQEIEQSVCEKDSDLTINEVGGVVAAAKPYLAGRAWPLYVKQAWLQGMPAWIVASGDGPGTQMYICPPTQKEIHDDKVRAAKENMDIVVVAGVPPYRVLTR